MAKIDLRSDMLGRRPASVLQAMTAAAADAPQMEDADDPRQRALAEAATALFGMPAALFLPTCTMANQIALRLRCAPGETVVAQCESHLVIREADAACGFHGARFRTFAGHRGHPSPAEISSALAENGPGRVGLVWLENTHNASGGTVMPPGDVTEIARLCARAGVPLHMDGSRIWHAAVASGCPPEVILRGVDSLAVSFNKALDAPVGALLLGSAEFIAEAAQLRHALGGFWRPAGMLAAAALAAMEDHAPRLRVLHQRAARLAARLRDRLPGLGVEEPETNIVMLRLPAEERVPAFLAALRAQGVDALPYGEGRVRFVLHSGIGDAEVESVASACAAAGVQAASAA